MDIVTYKLAQKYANKVAAGFSSVTVDGLDIIFTLNDGKTATVTVPAPKDGEDGQDGKSAYQIWLDEGNVGTEEDFLESLKGEKGDCNFATFDIEDGNLIMNKNDDMNIDFVINQGNLEVTING